MWTGEDEDGFPISMLDGQGFGAGGILGESHHSFGFMSKPLDPDKAPNGRPIPGKSCNLLIGKIGNEVHLWYQYDPRVIPKLPVLKKGGSIFYCATGSFRVFDGENGTETAYFPMPGNKAHIATTGLDGQNRPVVAIEHCDGMAITMLEHSVVIKNASGSVYIEINNTQIIINGNVVVNGGMTVGDPVLATPLAIAQGVAAYINSLEEAIASALGAVTVVGGGPAALAAYQLSHTPAVAGFLTAIAAKKSSGF